MFRLLYFIFCVILIVLTACNRKTHVDAVTSDGSGKSNMNLSGSWELHSRYGGNRIGGNIEVESGNGDVYTFIKNHFEHFANHQIIDSGRYEIARSKGPEQGDPLPAFVFNRMDTVLFTLEKDTLVLNPRAPMYDGVATKYVRVYLH